VEPVLSMYLPALQSVHAVAPGSPINLPTSHTVHSYTP
jgi:hypothetical protein